MGKSELRGWREWEWERREGALEVRRPRMKRRARGPGARRDVSTRVCGRRGRGRVATLARGYWGRGMWGWDLGVKIPIEPEKRLRLRLGVFSCTRGWEGIPRRARSWEGAVMGQRNGGQEGRRGRSGQPGAPEALVSKYSPPGDTPGSPPRPREAAGGFVELRGNLGFGEGTHRARLQRRGRRHARGPGNRSGEWRLRSPESL